MKRLITSCFLVFVGLFGLVAAMPTPVNAASSCTGGTGTSSAVLGFPYWYRGMKCDTINGNKVVNVKETTIPTLVWTVALNVLEILLRIAGILAVIMILASAFQYITNGGNEQKIAKAKTSLIQAVVGLAIAICATTIIGFIMSGVSG